MAPEYLAAALAGLLGGGHCIAMCGPLLLATRLGRRPMLLVMANLGRIASYALAGALVAGASQQLGRISAIRLDHPGWRWALGAMILLSGIQLCGWWRGLHQLEAVIGPLWRRLSLRFKGFIPPQTPFQALCFGLLWGWLPCGLVYGVLLWALLQPTALQGSAIMVVFGLSTVPLLAIGAWSGEALLTRVPRARLTQITGYILILLGLFTIASA